MANVKGLAVGKKKRTNGQAKDYLAPINRCRGIQKFLRPVGWVLEIKKSIK